MRWFTDFSSKSVCLKGINLEVRAEAAEIGRLLGGQLKTASADKSVHFYLDPKLAENFKVNLHLIKENDEAEAQSALPEDPKTVYAKAEEPQGDFAESTVSFVSKKTSDPNYLCSIVFQRPEGKVYCVSAYLMETYLGRYAFRANFYFRAGSRRAAGKCYDRVVRAMRELKQDVMEDDILQNRVPLMMRKRLSGIDGEIEPKVNKMAIYLDPEIQSSEDPTKSVSTYIPAKRSITEDLLMPEDGA